MEMAKEKEKLKEKENQKGGDGSSRIKGSGVLGEKSLRRQLIWPIDMTSKSYRRRQLVRGFSF